MANELTVQQEKAVSLRDYLQGDNVKSTLAQALPKWLSVDRLLRIVFASTLKNPKLMECTKESLLQSIMQCAQLGLEPILGRAYLIPYENSKKIGNRWEKVLECQFQIGYQGLVDLARRSGEIKDVFARTVYEKDEFEIEYGTSRKLVHKPCLKEDAGNPIGAYAVWENKEGLKSFEFMPLHEIYKRRDKSQAYKYSIKNDSKENPWIQWPEEMMCKTVIKHMAKMQPASIDFMEAVELDNVIETSKLPGLPLLTDNSEIYIDDKQLSTLRDMLADKETPESEFCSLLEIESLETMPISMYEKALQAIKAKIKREPGDEVE